MRYEVAVIGGGLAGLVAAAALGRERIRVAIVEARPQACVPHPERDFDVRVSTVSPVSRRILHNLGVWPRVPVARRQSFESMRVWDRAGFGEVCFDAAMAGLPDLGHVVENRELQVALEAVCAGLDTVRWYRPETVEAIDCGAEWATIHTGGARLESRLVVAADGARSRARELAGIPTRTHDYGQDAVVATVRTQGRNLHAGSPAAWQRFLPSGPIAFLPLPRGWSSVVWSTLPEDAAALENMPAEAFALELERAMEHRLGCVEEIRGRARFALTRVKVSRYLAPRMVLIGDAAHTIHPLAGQGVNLGFLDGAALAEVLSAQLARGRDPGLVGNLRAYERARRAHNETVADAMSAFHHVFTSRLPALGWLRNAGFAVTERSAALKRLFVGYASGLAGELPRLARTGDDL